MKRARIGSALTTVLAGIVVSVVLVVLTLPLLQRNGTSCGALSDVAQLKQIHLATTTYLAGHEALPSTWMFLFREGSIVPELCWSPINPRRRDWKESPRLGEYVAADFYDMAVDDGDLYAVGRRVVGDALWERLDDVMVSREARVHRSFHPDLVAGFTLMAGKHPGSGYRFAASFITADNNARYIPIRKVGKEHAEYLELVAADKRARASLGLSEPPDYAALVLQHTAEQKRLAAEGK